MLTVVYWALVGALVAAVGTGVVLLVHDRPTFHRAEDVACWAYAWVVILLAIGLLAVLLATGGLS